MSISITVNGEERTVPDGLTLAALLRELGITDRPVACSVNRTIVPKADIPARRLQNQDQVDILQIIGGG